MGSAIQPQQMPGNTHNQVRFSPPCKHTIHSEALEAVASARYPGVDIANDLSWETHITRITNTANKSLGFLLKRNLGTQNTSLWENAYKAIVRAQLGHAAPVWDPHTKDDMHKIVKVQRRAAQWVLGVIPPTQASQT